MLPGPRPKLELGLAGAPATLGNAIAGQRRRGAASTSSVAIARDTTPASWPSSAGQDWRLANKYPAARPRSCGATFRAARHRFGTPTRAIAPLAPSAGLCRVTPEEDRAPWHRGRRASHRPLLLCSLSGLRFHRDLRTQHDRRTETG